MRFGEAPIAEHSSLRAMLERRWYHRRRVRQGLVYMLTVLFWGLWTYLVLPVVSLVLWFMGARLFYEQMVELGGYESLIRSLGAYSAVFLAIVAFLLLWILWNVTRYGGHKDRRTVKAPDVSDAEVATVRMLDESLLPELRTRRRMVVDLDFQDCLVVTGIGRSGRRSGGQGVGERAAPGSVPDEGSAGVSGSVSRAQRE